MSQMNPLIGPVLNQRTLFAIKEYWVRIFRKKNQRYFESPILTDFFFLHIFRTAGRLLRQMVGCHIYLDLSLPWNKPKVFNALEKNWFIGIFVKVLQISLVFFMIFLLSYLLIVLTVRQFWIEAKSCSKSKTSFYSIKVKFFLISQFNWQYSCVFDSLTVSWHLCCWVQWLVWEYVFTTAI